jgi:hypothetical protein
VAPERLAADYSIQPWNVLYDTVTFRRAMRSLAGGPGKQVIFNVGDYHAVQAMYYAGCPAYATVPDPAVLRRLLQQRYQVYVVLDELQTNREAILALHQAGLLERTIPVQIGGPRVQRRKHPYLN